MIKFVSDLRQVGDFLRVFRFPPLILNIRDRCGNDRMVVGFTTTYAISAYHAEIFVSDYRQDGGFFPGYSGFLHQ